MKMINKPNKQVQTLLIKISKSDAIQLLKAENDDWKEKYWTQGVVFSDLKVWIRKTIGDLS